MYAETAVLNKMIILYALSKAASPLPNTIITGMATESNYMSYFDTQIILNELIDDSFIAKTTVSFSTCYSLTDEGREALKMFGGRLSAGLREEVDTYLTANDRELVARNTNDSEYVRVSADEFAINLRIRDNNSIVFSVSLSVPDEATARTICSSWDKKSADVYACVLSELT